MIERYQLSKDIYCKVYRGGLNNEARDALAFAYERIVYCGYLKSLFWGFDVLPNKKEFVSYIGQEKFLPVMLYDKEHTPIALEWIEDALGVDYHKQVHFSTFDLVPQGVAVQATRLVMKEVGHKKFGYRQYIGIVPACLRHSLQFCYACGYEPVTRMHKTIHCLGKERDAVLLVCDPKTL